MPGDWWRGSSGDGEYEIVGYQRLDGSRYAWYPPGMHVPPEHQYPESKIDPGYFFSEVEKGHISALIIRAWPKGDPEAATVFTSHLPFRGHTIGDVLRAITIAASNYGIELAGLEDDFEILDSAGE